MVLLCPRHHTETHARTWTLTMHDGIPWAIPPDWIDPTQTPQRNTFHHDLHAIHDLALHLRHTLDDHDHDHDHDDDDHPTRGDPSSA